MSGYTPLFGSLTTGTLCGRWPDIGLWPVVLSLADRPGVVDVTTSYLALITGLPEHDVVACLQRFCAPDPLSRTQDHDGRRLVLLDPARPWGWRVVNHATYRERARLAAKSAAEVGSGRNAARIAIRRKQQTAGDRRTPPLTAPQTQTQTQTQTEKEKEEAQLAAPTTAGVPASKKKTGTANRGTRLPENFELTPERRKYAEQHGIRNIGQVFEKFCNHFIATPGSKGVKLDWDATWRNWVLTESERPDPQSKFDRIHSRLNDSPQHRPFPTDQTPAEFRGMKWT